MIITNLIGGLGNQMFQAACGRAMSLRTGLPLKLSVDQFASYRLHNGYQIPEVFAWQPDLATREELHSLIGWRAHPWVRRLLGRTSMHAWTGPRWANEPHAHFWPGLLHAQGPHYVHGYWQSERYFADAIEQVRADFEFRLPWDAADLAVLELMHRAPSVSLHVRRGDYLNAKNAGLYATPGLDYYRAALAYVRERVPGIRCFAFSDDPQWVLQTLGQEVDALTVVTHNTGRRSPRDMRLMSQATHHIIANSSFSWWGAWLNPSPEKIVVAPMQWHRDEQHISSRDLIPGNWARL